MSACFAIPYLGTFLLIACGFTQITADHAKAVRSHLAQREIAGSLEIVVAAFPQWAETYRLNRYPSPDGRPCTEMYRPPFFAASPMDCAGKRGVAQTRSFLRQRFDARDGMALSADTHDINARGELRCSSVILSRFPSSCWARLQPAVIRRPNRPCSAVPPVQALRRSSGDRSLQGRPWGPRATWRSARFTRKNASDLNSAPGDGPPEMQQAIVPLSRGGGFSMSSRSGANPGTGKKKGT